MLRTCIGIERKQRHLIAYTDFAAFNSPDSQPAEIRRVIDSGHEHLKWSIHLARRCGNVLDDRIEQRRQIDWRYIEIHRCDSVTRGCVYHRSIELRFVSLEFDEKIEHFVVNTKRVSSGPVDLIDDDNWSALQLECFSKDEACLRHWPVESVDDEQHSIHHAKNSLDLTAEVGVTRRVDDVDLRAPPSHRSVLGENRNAALTLEWIRVEHALHDDLIFSERACLAEHLVYQRGLTVIDVRDDSDVSDFLRVLHSSEAIGAQ